ncbi:bb in a boxcar [Anaeramoeba flamelloides]|uniref:Bb in a boxcar n=1 Tax=Anaeramoeba flamelloides TaxID=1746091 RepID=A0ABQ8YVM2_9EUKA|nr:bb in a boxcar [Anaeramoeba flamelloides]
MSKSKKEQKKKSSQLPFLLKPSYLNNEELNEIVINKYKGKNDSILYKYWTSPVCNWLVQKVVPSWLAPNLITFLGFVPIFLHSFLLAQYSPKFEQPIPRYTAFLSFLTAAFYSYCDNIDGKQARKTDTATALGQMFDHGIDCAVGMYMVQNIASTLQIGNTWLLYSNYLLALGGFYLTTWEEYCCEKFYLGYINGADEGTFLIRMLCLAAFIKPDMFQMTIFGFSISEITMILMFVAGVPTILTNFVKSFKSENFKIHGFKWITLSLLPCIVTLSIAIAWRLFNKELFEAHPRLIFTIIGYFFANINLRVLVAHLSHNFNTWYFAKRLWILFITPAIYYGLLKSFIDEMVFLWVFAIVLMLCFLHMFASITVQMSTSLKINVFTIKKKKI